MAGKYKIRTIYKYSILNGYFSVDFYSNKKLLEKIKNYSKFIF